MNLFTEEIQVRWADIDANRHLRHSVYYDYGATARINILSKAGLTMKKLEELKIGPVLFREEAIFKREVIYEDKIALTTELVRATENYARWSIRHNFIKADGTLAAIINIDAAWIDLEKRKLALPDDHIQNIFAQFPKATDFEFVNPQKKNT
jgi:acyl-CoA thioester hydrolase